MLVLIVLWIYFFFQAEDGIRDVAVTGVQTCALPICGFPRDDRAPSTRGKPLPHSRRRASVLRLAHLGTGDAGLGALGLALTLRFLLGPLLVGLAPALEAVIAAAAQRSPMRTSY